MANNKTTSETTKTAGNRLVCCLNCLHAKLHRYDNNPVLSACEAQPQPGDERFPFRVEVASTMRHCACWKLDPNPKDIEQRSKTA